MSRIKQHGYILVTSLLFLIVLTVLGVSGISSVTMQERMASNLREKQNAFEASAIALRDGEIDLRNRFLYPSSTTLPADQAVDITSTGVDAGVVQDPQYTLAEVTSKILGGGITPASQLGKRTMSQAYFYSVTSTGWGGNDTAVSVQQSIYARIY